LHGSVVSAGPSAQPHVHGDSCKHG
jgi:zinc transport system ATP-binding protein